MELGIVPANDVDVRSSVCSDEASEEELAMVDSGDGDKDCELTSLVKGISDDYKI